MRYSWSRKTTSADVFDTNALTAGVIERAHDAATRLGSGFVDPTHLMLGILDGEESVNAELLAAIGTNAAELRAALERSATSRKQLEAAPSGRLEYTSRALNALRLAMANSRRRRETGGGTPDDLLLAILQDEGSATWKACVRAGVDRERVAHEQSQRLP